eukprot:1157945-Pelagomonas_calceolata.AAC.3
MAEQMRICQHDCRKGMATPDHSCRVILLFCWGHVKCMAHAHMEWASPSDGADAALHSSSHWHV